MHRFFQKVNSKSERKSDSKSTSTPLIKQVMTTDKNLQDHKAPNRKRQAVNGFSAPKYPDCIMQLESRPPKGTWHPFDSMDIKPLKLLKYGNKSVLVSTLLFAIFAHGGWKRQWKGNSADNFKSAINTVPLIVQDYLS